MAGDAAKARSLREQLAALPEHRVGQTLDGELVVLPRPNTDHANAVTTLGEELGPPFRRGRGGPGGWVILDESELHLAEDVVVPDVAGWRRERMTERPSAPAIALAPDWVCEALSPGTVRVDRKIKRSIYAREGVAWLWFVDPAEHTLEVFHPGWRRLPRAPGRVGRRASARGAVRRDRARPRAPLGAVAPARESRHPSAREHRDDEKRFRKT